MAGELDGVRVVWLRARHGGVTWSARASSEGRSQQHYPRIARANALSARRREHRSRFVKPCEAQSAGALRQAPTTCTVVRTVIFEVSSEVGHFCILR